jgi:hypothetical protein
MLTVSTPGDYSVRPVVPADVPWPARVRLRSARRKGRTGLILYGIIRQSPRAMTRQLPFATVSEGKRDLASCSPVERRPKWVPLAPGQHELRFHAGNTLRFSVFDERVSLDEGDVLVAVCEPVQPRTFYAKSPEADRWSLGIIDSGGHARPVRPAQP